MNPIAPTRSRASTAPTVAATALATLLALVVTLLGSAPAAAAPVDDYAGYEGQETCVGELLPGTAFLQRWLLRQYPGTGYISSLRGCNVGGQSEHKDGRAVDWGVDAADPADRARVEDFLKRIFATDKQGNRHALARRMGIMYLIWNDHSYSAYRGFEKRDYTSSYCKKWSNCSKTTRHRDHVHISLSRSGGAGQTTFYRARNVEPAPVLYPGTRQLDPDRTAILEMSVPADGSTVVTDFKLKRGTSYRLVADGRFRFGPGSRIGDANCRWRRGQWRERDNALLVNGASPWATPCDGRHTHEAVVTPTGTDFLRLTIDDRTPRANEGGLTVYVLREDIPTRSVRSTPPASSRAPRPWRKAGRDAEPLQRERATVAAARRRGTLTRGALRAGTPYRVVVRGTATSAGRPFDGNCVRYAGRLRRQHTLDLAKPGADHLSLYIQNAEVSLRAPASAGDCDSQNHRYVGRFRAPVDGRARIRIWDPYSYDDNGGRLTVRLIRKG